MNTPPEPDFFYQFLPADKYPLGNSNEARPWLAIQNDSYDAITTIYPRTTSTGFLEGAPSDIDVPNHEHLCSINKAGSQYLRDCVTAIERRNFGTRSYSKKKGCSGETLATKRAVIKSLQSLSEGNGSHLDKPHCAIGSIVVLRPRQDSKTQVMGLVVDHWVKKSRASEPVLLLALVTEFNDDSTGYFVVDAELVSKKVLYPGVQFLSFEKDVESSISRKIDGAALHIWPALDESDRNTLAIRIGLPYEPAKRGSLPGKELLESLAALTDLTRPARLHQTTRPSVTPNVAVRTLSTRDLSTALIANSVAASSKREKQEYVSAMRALSGGSEISDTYLLSRTAHYLPMTADLLPSGKHEAPKPSAGKSIDIELVSPNTGFANPELFASVRAHLVKGFIENKNLRFLNFVDRNVEPDLHASLWKISGRLVEVRHIRYDEGRIK